MEKSDSNYDVKKEIVILGASVNSKSLTDYIINKIESYKKINYLVDNDVNKHHTIWKDKYKIYSVEHIQEHKNDVFVIIALAKEYDNINHQLNEMGMIRGINYEYIKKINSLYDENEYLYYRLNNGDDLWKPSQIRIELSSYCNIKCVYCRYHSQLFHNQVVEGCNKNMDWETVKNISNQIMDIPSVKTILNVQKGEMFCNPEWYEMLKYMLEHTHIKNFHFSTNGMLLTKSNLDLLVQLPFDNISITISIDGNTPEENNEFRVGSNFETIKNNMKYLEKIMKVNDKIKVNIQSLYFSEYEDDKSREVPSFLSNESIFYNSIVRLPILGQSEEKYNDLLCAKYNLKSRAIHIENEIACPLPLVEIAIDSEGYVCVCGCDPRGNLTRIGNVNKRHMLEIWNDTIMQDIRIAYATGKDVALCIGCAQYAKNNNKTSILEKSIDL